MTAEHTTSKRILITGFGAFPDVPINATSELVPLLATQAGNRYREHAFSWDVLPVTWQGGPAVCAGLVGDFDPDVIIHFGVSDRASGFVVETQARNFCQAAPDAGGALPPLHLLDESAPSALAATLPCQVIVARLERAGLPAVLSEDAGGYLCNAVLFQTLNQARAGVRAGFIHLPVSLGGPQAALSLDDALRGGLTLLDACLEP